MSASSRESSGWRARTVKREPVKDTAAFGLRKIHSYEVQVGCERKPAAVIENTWTKEDSPPVCRHLVIADLKSINVQPASME